MLNLNGIKQIICSKNCEFIKETYGSDSRYTRVLMGKGLDEQISCIYLDESMKMVIITVDNETSGYAALSNKEFDEVVKDLESRVRETVTHKYTIFHYTEDEIEQWVKETVPLDQLDKAVSRQLHLPETDVFFEVKRVYKNGNSYSVELKSKINLSKKNPILEAAWPELYLETFGSWVTLNKDGNLEFRANIQFSYNHWSGGSNGSSIGTFWSKDGEYMYIPEKESHEKRYWENKK